MRKKAEIYFSNAEWSKIPKTYDSHQSLLHARAVCLMLLNNKQCEIRGKCLKVWATDQDGYIHYEKVGSK
jgi:hypothetical protein